MILPFSTISRIIRTKLLTNLGNDIAVYPCISLPEIQFGAPQCYLLRGQKQCILLFL